MRRIADQCDTVGMPAPQRVDVVDRPGRHLIHVEIARDVDNPLVETLDRGHQVVLRHRRRPAPVTIEGRQVVGRLTAVTQRQQVELRAAPEEHPEVVIENQPITIFDRKHRAIGMLPGEDRFLIANSCLRMTDLMPSAADYEISGDTLVVGECDRCAVALVDYRLGRVPEPDHARRQHAHECIDEIPPVYQVGGNAVGIDLGPRLLDDQLASTSTYLKLVAWGTDIGDGLENSASPEAV